MFWRINLRAPYEYSVVIHSRAQSVTFAIVVPVV